MTVPQGGPSALRAAGTALFNTDGNIARAVLLKALFPGKKTRSV